MTEQEPETSTTETLTTTKKAFLTAEEWLTHFEVFTVFSILLVAVLSVLHEIWWRVCGGPWPEGHARFGNALGQLDSHWKLALGLLVPLFYRTIRQFLQEAENIFGVNRPKRPKSDQDLKQEELPKGKL